MAQACLALPSVPSAGWQPQVTLAYHASGETYDDASIIHVKSCDTFCACGIGLYVAYAV